MRASNDEGVPGEREIWGEEERGHLKVRSIGGEDERTFIFHLSLAEEQKL